MPRRSSFVPVLVVGVIAVTAYFFFAIPVRWGMSDEEVTDAARRGRRVFLASCAPCHAGEGGLPTQRDMQQDYSERELSRVLTSPRDRMPPFTGTAEERRDLIIFLTGE